MTIKFNHDSTVYPRCLGIPFRHFLNRPRSPKPAVPPLKSGCFLQASAEVSLFKEIGRISKSPKCNGLINKDLLYY